MIRVALLLVLAACEHESVSREPTIDRGSDHVAEVTPDAAARVEPAKTTVASDAALATADAPIDVAADAKPPRDPMAPKVAFFDDKNRKILDSIIDQKLSAGTLGKLAGIGTASPAKINVGASTTTSDIDRVFKSRLGLIRACYAKELANKPGLGGKVIVKFEIAPTGAVQNATATGMDDAVTTCIVRQVKQMKFAAPADGKVASVTYPLIFTSG